MGVEGCNDNVVDGQLFKYLKRQAINRSKGKGLNSIKMGIYDILLNREEKCWIDFVYSKLTDLILPLLKKFSLHLLGDRVEEYCRFLICLFIFY